MLGALLFTAGVINCAAAGFSLASGSYWPAAASFVLGQVCLNVGWRKLHGSWSTRRDRHNPGTAPDPGPFSAGALALGGAGFPGGPFTGVAKRNGWIYQYAGGVLVSVIDPHGRVTTGPVADVVADVVNVPETTAEVPILGYKRVQFGWRPGGFYCDAYGGPVERDAYAKHVGSDHDAPHLGCLCGFNAVKVEENLSRGSGCAIAEVELSGRVIVYEHGYRAEHQHVLRVRIPGRCWICGQPAVQLGVHTASGSGTARCATHVMPDEWTFTAEDLSGLLDLPIVFDPTLTDWHDTRLGS